MTIEERLSRIEQLSAGIAEERRRDRDEYKALWRDTQRQISDLAAATIELHRHVDQLAVETRLRFDAVADSLTATNQRIQDLVSALGTHLRQGHAK